MNWYSLSIIKISNYTNKQKLQFRNKQASNNYDNCYITCTERKKKNLRNEYSDIVTSFYNLQPDVAFTGST